jgi:hypothetical protein
VLALVSSNAYSRQLMHAFCKIGRPEIGQPGQCRPGGHSCWIRIVEPRKEPAPSVAYAPHELPIAMDFLNVIWKQAFGAALIQLRSVEKTTALAVTCANQDEFRARLGDLHELFKLMEVVERLLPADKQGQLHRAPTFDRMEASLSARISDEVDRDRVVDAIGDLRALSKVRNNLTHGGSELVAALDRLGITYPISDHGKAWDRIRAKITEGLTTIRAAVEATLE